LISTTASVTYSRNRTLRHILFRGFLLEKVIYWINNFICGGKFYELLRYPPYL
ncbi:hypothetical protein L9F63_017504, partial [Diploptera punctata]